MRFSGDSADDCNGGPGLTGLKLKEKRRIKHVLDSGLVIEVESTGLPGSPVELTSCRATIPKTLSPESPHGDDSQSASDDSVSAYSSEYNTIPPGQVTDDYYFEPSIDELQLSKILHTDNAGDPAQSPAQFDSHSVTIGRTPSPESPHGRDCRSASDDSVMYDYHYPSEWDINPPRQGGDWYFEQSADDEAKCEPRSFYHGDSWRQRFIPTLLRFLGTSSNPWDWYGDSFSSLLRHVWTTVYGKPSWSDEDECLVHTLAEESVTSWLDSFGSNALGTVEDYLKRLTGGVPNFSEWAVLCTQMVQDGRLFYESSADSHPHGIYRSVFVLAPLASHIQAIRGGMEVQGLRAHVPYHDGMAFPFGAIGLAAAAALRAMLLFGMQLVKYDESGNIVIKTPRDRDEEIPAVDTSFSRSNAGGTTRQCALAACSLIPEELNAILSLASTSILRPDHEIISDNKMVETDD